MKIDPAELRRRNTIPPSAMPYKTPLTFTYDSGRFEENMDRAMKLADWHGFEARRKEAAKRGMLRGIGISNTIEQAADPTIETAEIRFDPLGGMTFVTGSISHGQGHSTIQTQMLVEQPRVDPEQIKFIQGDTDAVALRHGHRRLALDHDERAARSSWSARRSSPRGKKLAAHILGSGGKGDMSSRRAASPSPAPTAASGIHESGEGGVQARESCPRAWSPGLIRRPRPTRAALRQISRTALMSCEVEIDPETGVTQLVGYWVVDDVGTVINPMLVKGQIMGGIAQGMGQVLMEDKAYDASRPGARRLVHGLRHAARGATSAPW
jgi:carbon-monoxide dehydrogenase large subunit